MVASDNPSTVNEEQIRLEYRAVIDLANIDDRLQGLLRLAPDLPEDLLNAALSSVATLPDDSKGWFLSAISETLADKPGLLAQALEIAVGINNLLERSKALGYLGQYVEEEQLSDVIDRVSEAGSPDVRLAGWIPLIQRLPSELKEEAFDTSLTTGDDQLRVEAFQAFSGLMTETWKRRALESALAMTDYHTQLEALLALADNRSKVGRDALDHAWKLLDSSPDTQSQAFDLARLANLVPAIEHKRISERALKTLHEVSDPYLRASTAIDMAAYLPEQRGALYHLALDIIAKLPAEDQLNLLGYLVAAGDIPVEVEEYLRQLIQSLEDPEVRREAVRLLPDYFSVTDTQAAPAEALAVEKAPETELAAAETSASEAQIAPTEAVEFSAAEVHQTQVPTEDFLQLQTDLPWLGETLRDVLNYAQARVADAGVLEYQDLLAGLLAHGRYAEDDGFAHAVYYGIADRLTAPSAAALPEARELLKQTGLLEMPAAPAQTPESGAWRLSREVERLLQSAKAMQRDLTGRGPIQDRHLLAAFLSGQGDQGRFRQLLAKSGLQLSPLLEVIVGAIQEHVPEDSPSDWRRLLLPHRRSSAAISRLNKVVSDDPRGRDQLNLEREYNAFAAIIASSELSPPLAIGLFGDWGAGKSFFMEQIIGQIEAITEQIRDIEVSRFCKHIAQVRFNAWNYVDSNLWASLITRIFAGLAEYMAGGRETIVERKKNEIIAKLKRMETLEQEARRELQEARREVYAAAEQQQLLKEEYQKAVARLRELRQTSPLSGIDHRMIAKILTRRGRQALAAIKREHLAQNGQELDELVAGLRKGFGLLQKLDVVTADGGPNWNRLAGFAGIALLLAASGYLLGSLIEQLRPLFSAAVAMLAPLLPWGLQTVKRFNRHADTLVELWSGKDAETLKAEVTEEYEMSLRQAQEQSQVARERLDTAERNHAEAQDRLIEARRTTVELDPGRMFADFIEENAAKEQYRSQLGLISQIRQDLQDLADIFSADDRRWEGMEPRSDEGAALATEGRDGAVTKLDKLRRKPIKPIERIVLYIDDLDRCPPKRVAEVLQAVHLLLAFDLFVVVVAVDPRWLHRALEAYYPEFLESTTHDPKREGTQRRPRATTPRAYLEKIFQIPYVLPRMGQSGYQKLVQSLVGEEQQPPPAARTKASESKHVRKQAPARDVASAHDLKQPTIAAKTPPAPKAAIDSHQPRADSMDAVQLKPKAQDSAQTLTGQGQFTPVPEALPLETREINFMQSLHPLISTPRATKRLINIYKLIRITVPDEELHDFVSDRSTAAFRPMLLLLGMVIGFPEQAIELFGRMRQADDWESWWDYVESLHQFNHLEPPADDQAYLTDSQYWQRLYLALTQIGTEVKATFDPPMSRLKPYISRVERFSFEAAVSTLYADANGR